MVRRKVANAVKCGCHDDIRIAWSNIEESRSVFPDGVESAVTGSLVRVSTPLEGLGGRTSGEFRVP